MAVDDNYTVCLLHMDGADASTDFADESGKAWTAAGDAQIDTAQYKFGGASGLFDGVGDRISTPNSTDLDFGTGDFTFDFWIRRNGASAYPYIYSSSQHAGGNGFIITLGNSDNKVRVVYNNTEKILTATTIADLTWTHVAVVRYGNTVKVYINGTADANTDDCTGDTIGSEGTGAVIGRPGPLDSNYWIGWIDEFRISSGIARWTADFTPRNIPYGQGGQVFMWTNE